MVYWFAEFPRIRPRLDYDENQYQRDWHILEGLVRDMDAGQAFALTDDIGRCRFCNYRSLCDRGQLAGTDPEYEFATDD